jgi:hypothetical protein
MTEGKRNSLARRIAHVILAFVMLPAFGCVLFFGGHGCAFVFMFAEPNQAPGNPFIAAIWGATSFLIASYSLSCRPVAAITRLVAIGILSTVLTIMYRVFEPWQDAMAMKLTGLTTIPFAFFAVCDATIELAILRRSFGNRAAWTFTIRDIMILTVGASGFVLPMALQF